MQPLSSAISGAVCQASEAASSTGRRPGETGSASLPAVASERLLAMPTAEVEHLLEASLPPQAICWLKLRAASQEVGGMSPTLDRARPDAVAPVELERAILLHERAMLPAPESAIVKALTVLASMTKARAEDGADLRLRLRAYVRQLQAYPADIAMHVIETQSSHGPWWPSWSELAERLDWRRRKRQLRLDGLRILLGRRGDAA